MQIRQRVVVKLLIHNNLPHALRLPDPVRLDIPKTLGKRVLTRVSHHLTIFFIIFVLTRIDLLRELKKHVHRQDKKNYG